MSDKTCLFGAEVNRIQDTLFAAGLQRQVVGGSRLLAVFTEEAAEKIAPTYGSQQVIVKAGGNFRIIFSDKTKAKAFGAYIANTYYLLLDGVMTIPEPLYFEDRGAGNCVPDQFECDEPLCFTCANDKLEKKMRRLKRERPFTTTPVHVPTNAICQSSGTQPAEFWQPLEGEPEYMSGSALRMKEVGHVEKKGVTTITQDDEKEGFLEEIRGTIPESSYHHQRWARRPEELAAWDATQSNIAYLVADGNNMGKYFRQCRTPEQRQALSVALQRVVYEAIAAPIPKLAEKLFNSHLGKGEAAYLPLLPLIAAGDDVFIMLPAPYALAYAQQFCLVFSEKMDKAVAEIGLNDLPRITMSAGVVICKQSYPYLLAHQFGDRLLGQTKQVVKMAGPAFGWNSAVSFDMVIGSAGSNGRSYTGKYRPTLGTYWADDVANDAALPLQRLFDQRLALENRQNTLPAKRRAELRTLFDQPPGSPKPYKDWSKEFDKLMRRIKETSSDELYQSVQTALAELGKAPTEKNPTVWREVIRATGNYYAQGLLDLLAVWNYAQSLNVDLGQYE